MNLKVLLSFFKHPKQVISLGYQAMVRKERETDYEKYLADKYKKTTLPIIDLLDLFPDFHGTVNKYSYLPYTSLITDILLLKLFAEKLSPCSYLEIGSLRGESLACVAEVTKDCTSITLSHDEMIAFGYTERQFKSDGVFLRDTPGITTYRHNSQTFDFKALNKKFDLIFVDGDHTYNGVLADTKNVFNLLKDENSIIVWHDYSHHSELVRHDVLAAILDGTPDEYKNNLYQVSNTICAVFIRGKFNTSSLEIITYPNKIFKVSVSASKFE